MISKFFLKFVCGLFYLTVLCDILSLIILNVLKQSEFNVYLVSFFLERIIQCAYKVYKKSSILGLPSDSDIYTEAFLILFFIDQALATRDDLKGVDQYLINRQ